MHSAVWSVLLRRDVGNEALGSGFGGTSTNQILIKRALPPPISSTGAGRK